jgi:DNA-nicking Smr family endonuclease
MCAITCSRLLTTTLSLETSKEAVELEAIISMHGVTCGKAKSILHALALLDLL